MADKSIAQLNEAEKVYSDNLFVLHQAGETKKLSGSTLKNWLLEIANSLGGISKIEKVSTSGLKDTYRIYYAKDGTTTDFTVTNGEKGDKGDNSYIWIRYTGQKPTESSHSFGTTPDNWMGIYAGNSATAPTDYKQYSWFKIKGEKGDTGDAAFVTNKSVTYQVGSSGTTAPSGSWLQAVPTVPQGQFLWTKTDITFNTGDTITWYSVSRMGIDGTGAVSTVCGIDPDTNGNVPLTGADIPQSSDDPTSMSTAISGKQAKITVSGLLKGNGSGGVSAAAAGTDYQSPVKSATVTLSANAWSSNSQTINVSNVTASSLVTVAPVPTAQNRTAYLESGVYCSAQGDGTLTFVCEDVPSVSLNVNMFDFFIYTYGPTILLAILTAVFGVLGYGVKKIYIGHVNDETKRSIAAAAVAFVEQAWKALHGADKLNKALETAEALLKKKGITFDAEEMKVLIEAAVGEFNDVFRKTEKDKVPRKIDYAADDDREQCGLLD